MLSSISFTSIFCLLLGIALADRAILSMPQWPANYVDYFQLYSGYLDLPDSDTKKLHYVFVTSMNDPLKDPIVLWLNGGPGCSSLQGFISEIGPFVFDPTQTNFTGMNEYAWNKNASIIFLESPAGTGFSKGDPFNDKYNDEITTRDQYAALLDFFVRFPEYLDNDFWITGESYAGILVPNLAAHILKKNHKAHITLNLKGIMLGNPLTDLDTDEKSTVAFLYRRDFIPAQIYKDYKTCETAPNKRRCLKAAETIQELTVGLNIYDVYGLCQPSILLPGQTVPTESDPTCAPSQGAINYLNNPEVKKALRVDPDIMWMPCNDTIFKRYEKQGSTVDKYNIFREAGLRVLIYSGDVDGRVPTLDTEHWINELKFDVVDSWRIWRVNPEQIAGYVVVYDGLTFATVRGAGHMVPADKREEAYNMFVRFLNDEPL